MLKLILYTVLFTLVAASERCRLNPATYDFSFGTVRGTVVSDGPLIIENNPFLVQEERVLQSYRENFRSSNPFRWPQNVVVLDTEAGRILVDAGGFNTPNFPILSEAGQLAGNLKAAGISPESIDAILITHAHPDHVGGLTTLEGDAAFPNAKLFVPQVEHEFFTTDPIPSPLPSNPNAPIAGFAEVYRRNIKPYQDKGRLNLVRAGGRPLRNIRFVPAFGHTPGHSVIEVKSQGKSMIIAGDAWVSMPDQLQNPDWGQGFEINPPQASQSRISLLRRLAARRQFVVVYHEQFPGLGYVKNNGKGFTWIPAETVIGDGVQRQC